MRVTAELSRLLGVRYLPGSDAQRSAIGQALGGALPKFFAGQHRQATAEVMRLALLAQQLRLLEHGRPDVLEPLGVDSESVVSMTITALDKS